MSGVEESPVGAGSGWRDTVGSALKVCAVMLGLFIVVRALLPKSVPGEAPRARAPARARAIGTVRRIAPVKLRETPSLPGKGGPVAVPSPFASSAPTAKQVVADSPAEAAAADADATSAQTAVWPSYGGDGSSGSSGGSYSVPHSGKTIRKDASAGVRTAQAPVPRGSASGARSGVPRLVGAGARYVGKSPAARPGLSVDFDNESAQPVPKRNKTPSQKAEVPRISGGSAPADEKQQVMDGVMNQFSAEQSVMDQVSASIAEKERTGQPVVPEELKKEADEFVAQSGRDPEAVDVEKLVARSLNKEPPPDPKALGEHTQAVFANFVPPTPMEEKKIIEESEKPRFSYDHSDGYVDKVAEVSQQIKKDLAPPHMRSNVLPDGAQYGGASAPPPKGAIETYRRNEEAFKYAKEKLGVEPHHILGILGVETRYGNYTGNHGVMATLYTISKQGGRKGKQAQRDIAALMRLDQKGELSLDANSVKGSYAGAMGIPQFLPSSWEAYAKDRDGGGRDPFSYPDAIVSVANYLKVHGYQKDVAKSVWAYNHSQEYVDKVLGLSDRVKPGLTQQ